ncbi:MAG TPA: hypothetical protein VFU93_11260 [Acidimicrobiales bacterium]|nr:hypothetical protein [Acidimicrobiales bacterium]
MISIIALLGPVAAADAADDASSLGAPRAAGLLPAADAPSSSDQSPAAPLLLAAGLALLLGGAIVVGSSWVSPAEPV